MQSCTVKRRSPRRKLASMGREDVFTDFSFHYLKPDGCIHILQRQSWFSDKLARRKGRINHNKSELRERRERFQQRNMELSNQPNWLHLSFPTASPILSIHCTESLCIEKWDSGHLTDRRMYLLTSKLMPVSLLSKIRSRERKTSFQSRGQQRQAHHLHFALLMWVSSAGEVQHTDKLFHNRKKKVSDYKSFFPLK